MKKIIVLLFVCFTFVLAEAKILTVSNNTNSPGQYNNLQTAINAAAAGDTIYVHGSATSYGNINIKKRLTLLGTGYKPNKVNPLVSQIGVVQLDSLASASGASGTKITGFSITQVLGYSGGTNNILVCRNYFTSSAATKINVTGSGWLVENNIINANSLTVNNKANVIIRNNIFNGSTVATSNQASVVIANNIFLQTTTASAFTTISNALIANNIFSGSTPHGANVNTNEFDNNITYQTANDSIPFGTNTGNGNFVSQNPLFTNVPTNAFSYSYDFSLQVTSPGKNAGTDGKDLGIYGGASPMVDMTGSPAIPQIKSLTVLNPLIHQGDSLHVIIKANKQQ